MMLSVYFDLDGTLTDSADGITRSIQYALRKLDCAVPDAASLRWCLGPPLLDSFGTLIGAARAARALELYRERFTDVGWSENRVYPGVPAALERLCDDGYCLHVATSKPRVYAARIVEHFGLRRFFRGIYGSELDGTRTDKAELIAHALAARDAGTPLAMIGDRRHDIAGALANDLLAVGVTWGYGSAAELTAAGAHALADHPDALPALLRKGLAAAAPDVAGTGVAGKRPQDLKSL